MILTPYWFEIRIGKNILIHFKKKKKKFAILCVLGFKVGKSANMTPQIFFSQHFDMCIK
jgi:hypothetical protein